MKTNIPTFHLSIQEKLDVINKWQEIKDEKPEIKYGPTLGYRRTQMSEEALSRVKTGKLEVQRVHPFERGDNGNR